MNLQPNIQNHYKQWQLTRFFDTVSHLQTAFYGPKAHDKSKKTVLLIHGIGGDYHGAVPLGYELRMRFNVYIVELPGHGATHVPSDTTYTYWQRWSADLKNVFIEKNITIDHVIAHSFGCNVASSMSEGYDAQYIFINPVPRVTAQYVAYSKMILNIRYMLSSFYGWYPLALSRGMVLAHHRSSSVIDTLSWISKKTVCKPAQFRYQIEISTQFEGVYLFAGMSDTTLRKTQIIMGSHDTFSTEDYFDLRRDIPHARTKLLPGGHLLPIETPREVANELFED